MTQEQREHQHEEDGDSGEEQITVFVRGLNKETDRAKVKKGGRARDALGPKHRFEKGMRYKLNNRLLETDEETGELLENPVLEENDLLVISQTFKGGQRSS